MAKKDDIFPIILSNEFATATIHPSLIIGKEGWWDVTVSYKPTVYKETKLEWPPFKTLFSQTFETLEEVKDYLFSHGFEEKEIDKALQKIKGQTNPNNPSMEKYPIKGYLLKDEFKQYGKKQSGIWGALDARLVRKKERGAYVWFIEYEDGSERRLGWDASPIGGFKKEDVLSDILLEEKGRVNNPTKNMAEKLPKFEGPYEAESYFAGKGYSNVFWQIVELIRQDLPTTRKTTDKATEQFVEIWNGIVDEFSKDEKYLEEIPSLKVYRPGYVLMRLLAREIAGIKKQNPVGNPGNPEKKEIEITAKIKWIEEKIKYSANSDRAIAWEKEKKTAEGYETSWVEVVNVKFLSKEKIAEAFKDSIAIVSVPAIPTWRNKVEEELAFAGATKNEIYWLMSKVLFGRVLTYEVIVKNFQLEEEEIEKAFAGSRARISIPIPEEENPGNPLKIEKTVLIEKVKNENPSNPRISEYFGIEHYEVDGVVNLEEFKNVLKKVDKEKYEKFKEFWESETGYDLETYVEEEPIIYTKEALAEEYKRMAIEAGEISEGLAEYLNTDAMIEDEELSGNLGKIKIDGYEYYYHIY